jgi:ferric-dicitrate binding protein FerR (iron transport regulator)
MEKGPEFTEEKLRRLAERLLNGTITPEEEAMLKSWYYSFEEKEAAGSMTEDLEATGRRIKMRIDRFIPAARPQRSILRRVHPLVKVAAVLIIAFSVWLITRHTDRHGATAAPWQEFTAGAKAGKVSLPDGSIAWLNTDSRLRYRLNEGLREMSLEGEAYFDVKHDKDHAFIVHAGKTTTTVQGTVFDIKAYPVDGKIWVTVHSGKVQVKDTRSHIKVLTANKQVKFDNIMDSLAETTVSAAMFSTWIDGKLAFNNDSFEELTNELSRHFNIRFNFRNEKLKHCKFLATFNAGETLENILHILQQISGCTFTVSSDGRTVDISGEQCF